MNRTFGTVLKNSRLAAALAATWAFVSPLPPVVAAEAARPNIVLILVDNVGYGDLGCYGQAKVKTPNLDQLASEGIRFTSYYVGSPDEGAARASLMTGLEPRHSNSGFNRPLAPDAVTVASVLQQLGYRTGLVGNWGLGDVGATLPHQKGFDEFAGFLSQTHARNYYTDRLWRRDPASGFDGQVELPQNQNGQRNVYIPDMLTTSGMNFIRNNRPEPYNNHRPFFLCLSYPIPHLGAPLNVSPYAKEPWTPAEKDRANTMAWLDQAVGKVMARLKETKVETNTIVIFTSVNGPTNEDDSETEMFKSAGPLRSLHGSVYEGGLRVPFIVRWPARIKPGQVSEFPAAAWDLLPTLAEIASAPARTKTDGVSLLPIWIGGKQPARTQPFYWENKAGELKQGLREGNWKAVRIGTNPVELYDLKADPGEEKDVAAKNRAVVERVERLLKEIRP